MALIVIPQALNSTALEDFLSPQSWLMWVQVSGQDQINTLPESVILNPVQNHATSLGLNVNIAPRQASDRLCVQQTPQRASQMSTSPSCALQRDSAGSAQDLQVLGVILQCPVLNITAYPYASKQ